MKPFAIDYAKRFKEKQTNKFLYDSLTDVQWKFMLQRDWQIVGCGVCEKSWEAATGEKPTKFFER